MRDAVLNHLQNIQSQYQKLKYCHGTHKTYSLKTQPFKIMTQTRNDHINISIKLNFADHQFVTYPRISTKLLEHHCVVIALYRLFSSCN